MKDRINAIIANVQQQLETMSPRDRNLLTGLVATLAVLLVLGVAYNLNGVLQDRASRVVNAKNNLRTAQELMQDHAVLSARIASAEARMGEFRANQMNTYVEGWANNAGVLDGLKQVRETGSQMSGTFRERDYRVEVQRIELEGLLRFVYAVETSPYPIRIRSTRVRVVEQRGERLLDLAVDLVTYAKEEA